MKIKNYTLRLLIGGILALSPAAIAQQVLDNNAGLSVYGAGINLHGDVVGGLYDPVAQANYGYYFYNNGLSGSVSALAAFCPPGACTATSRIIPSAINNAGLIVGSGAAVAGSTSPKGWFCTAPCSSYTVIDISGAYAVRPSGVSNTGIIVGSWEDASNVPHAFIRDERGRITKFEAPNISRSNPTYVTPGMVINGNGDTAGHFVDISNVAHIFYRTAKGQVTTYDIPNSQGLGVYGINNAGVIVGFYIGADGRSRGFMLPAGGKKSTPTITSCDYLPAAFGQTLTAINNNGIAIGTYYDASFNIHAFRCNANGATSSLDYGPDGTTTLVQGLNDNNVYVFSYANGPVETTTAQTIIRALP